MREAFTSENILFNGLNDPVYISGLRISNDHMRTENFVEVVISNDNHWVCITGSGEDSSNAQDISLFDSMRRLQIDKRLGTTCSLITVRSRLEKGYLIFRVHKTQKQRAQYCGYFALANAMALCTGLIPEMLVFAEISLREHFINIMYNSVGGTVLRLVSQNR